MITNQQWRMISQTGIINTDQGCKVNINQQWIMVSQTGIRSTYKSTYGNKKTYVSHELGSVV